MKRILKWIGIILGVVIGFVLVAYVAIVFISNNRINQTYEVTADYTLASANTADIAEGERIYTIYCSTCHGDDAAGYPFSEDATFGIFYAANLTSGQDGIASQYTDEEIAQTIWYGVRPDGSLTVGMPYEFNRGIDTEDMAHLIAYLRSVPPIDTNYPDPSYGPIMRVMHVTGLFPFVTAEHVNMDLPPPAPVTSDDVLAQGEYLSVFCTACHGSDFAGNDIIGGPNITPTGIGSWTEEEFVVAITTGALPDGTSLDPELMPYETFAEYTDDEIHAIWEYLQTVPPVAIE